MTNRPRMIGVTGGIGSGKSLICKIFSCLGVPVYDADSRAKSIMTSDDVLTERIKATFGDGSYDTNGSLNRSFLASEVFSSNDKLEKLNQLVHPRVQLDFENWVEGNKMQPYVVKEAALLLESGSYKKLDQIIVVSSPVDVRMQRVLARDRHRSESDIRQIMSNQISEEEKIKKAHFVILNDETQLVIPQVLKLHERFNQAVYE
jgi:dephospho-CoA kinase